MKKQADHLVFKACNISRLYAESALRVLGVSMPEAIWQGFDKPSRQAIDHVTYRHYFEDETSFWPYIYVDVHLIVNKKSKWGYIMESAKVTLPNATHDFQAVATGHEKFQVKSGAYELEEVWHMFVFIMEEIAKKLPKFYGIQLLVETSSTTGLPFRILYGYDGSYKDVTEGVVLTSGVYLLAWQQAMKVLQPTQLEKVHIIPRTSFLSPGVYAAGAHSSVKFQTSRA